MSSASSQSSFDLVYQPLGDGGEELPVVPLSGEVDWDEMLPRDAPGTIEPSSAPQVQEASPAKRIEGSGGIFLDGDVLGCPCPDCRAPMTVRLWLMIADCWRCGTSVELTEEQEREANRLLAEREMAARADAPPPSPISKAKVGERTSAAPPPPASTIPSAASARARPAPAASSTVATPAVRARRIEPSRSKPPPPVPGSPQPKRLAAAANPIGVRKKIHQMREAGAVRVWARESAREMPAWLISALLHMALLMLLGLLTADPKDDPIQIVLSTNLAAERREGDVIRDPQTGEEVIFDLPISKQPTDDRQRKLLVDANERARELRLDPRVPQPTMAPVEQVKRQVRSGHDAAGFASRDPRLRIEMVTREGGTTQTDAAVALGLQWIARQQNGDGSWSFSNEKAGTALALMAFLGAGQTHQVGKYKDQVAHGVKFLLSQQQDDGNLGRGGNNWIMYTHGQGAIALCELFAMTGEESLREPAQRAIDFIVKAQYTDGGWRYDPNTPNAQGDTSVVGWQLMALVSARHAQLDVPDYTLNRIEDFLETVQRSTDETGQQAAVGSRYAYKRGDAATAPMTAEALLCCQYLGWPDTHPAFRSAASYFVEQHPPRQDHLEFYYWYYATQVLHHLGGPQWEAWNEQMREALVHTQQLEGADAGSWHHRGGEGHNDAGPLYATALATCILEVYYRHLPIYRKVVLE